MTRNKSFLAIFTLILTTIFVIPAFAADPQDFHGRFTAGICMVSCGPGIVARGGLTTKTGGVLVEDFTGGNSVVLNDSGQGLFSAQVAAGRGFFTFALYGGSDLPPALPIIMALRPVVVGTNSFGFNAVEVAAVAPEFLSEVYFAREDESAIPRQVFNESAAVATLWKAVQELEKEVQQLREQLRAETSRNRFPSLSPIRP